jgi:putative salt-induced outer membrane protein YdiY
MTHASLLRTCLASSAMFIGVVAASAQTPAPAPAPPPPPGWTGSASAGLALTQGNSDTSTTNLAYEVKRDTGTKMLYKSTGLYIRSLSEGELTTDRMAFVGRVDRKFSDKTSLFGDVQYLRDSFKEIDYLVSPTVGLSRWLVKDDRTGLAVDAAVGMVWEKNPAFDVQASGAINLGQNFTRKLTGTSEFTQKVAALWKMDDFDDALYTFGVGLAVNVTSVVQMKAEFLDTYKNKPLSDTVVKNDIAVLLSFVYKFD